MNAYEALQQHIDRKSKWYFYRRPTNVKRILHDIEGLCGTFVKLGLSKGDVVTLYLPTCPQSIAAFYACSKLGLVASFVHPRMSFPALADIVRKTGSKTLMFFDALVDDERKLADIAPTLLRCSVADYQGVTKPFFALYSRLKCKRLPTTLAYADAVCDKTPTTVVGTDNDVVCYMHSGGTSGEAKIVALSNRAMNYVATTIGKLHCQESTRGKYALVTLPVFHAYGLCASVHAPLLIGYGLALVPKFSAKSVHAYLSKLNVGLWMVVPAMLRKLLKADSLADKGLANVKDLWCGGDAVDESLMDEVNAVLKQCGSSAVLLRGYGLTETCGAVVVSSQAHCRKKSCGLPIDGTRIEVVDDNERVLPPNTVGELVVYSPALMTSYVGGGENWSADGGVKTGDIGYIDNDGYVYIVDRKKRSVKIASVNVFPAEVERCICTLPQVSECCVVGYLQKGKQYLKAYVTLANDVAIDLPTLTALVRKTCLANLSPYSVPECVEILAEMPLTKMGKADYRKLEGR